MLIYFIVGVIAGIIGANMAKSRRQNPAIWFIVCFIFPIAVFGLLFIEKKEDSCDIKTALVNGKMSKRALKMVFEWLDLHKDELMEDWNLAQNRKTLLKIPPLS